MKILSASIELAVSDIEKTLKFYKSIFKNLSIDYQDNIFASVSINSLDLMFYKYDEFSKEIPQISRNTLGGTFVIYLNIKDIDKFFNSIKNNVEIIQKLHTTDYGSKEFAIKDLNGYVLIFSESYK